MLKDLKAIKIDSGEMTVLGDDIVLFKPRANYKMSVSDLVQLQEERIKAIGDKPFYTIFDIRDGATRTTSEGKAWAVVNRKASQRLMDIVLVKGRMTKIIVSLFKNTYKSEVKTVTVRSIEEALAAIEESKR